MHAVRRLTELGISIRELEEVLGKAGAAQLSCM